ncbi:MAG: homocysteine S-methyltransferase family protein [Candidatus Aminicenantes bacterium]|nr:homocysteine S-methyltransferase family protein [Candidatus Aminicenantes bacterium]
MSLSILQLAQQRIVLLDGGMGTELIKKGFTGGGPPEAWNIEKPDIVKKIHKRYFDAGSDAVLTNSFGGNRIKLASFGMEKRCSELNKRAAELACGTKPKGKYVGGSMGPTGKFLKPYGDFTEDEFIDAYCAQAEALSEGGVDFLLIETQYDLKEAVCAIKGARKACGLPLFVTMTFKNTPRGFFTEMGNSVSQCVKELENRAVSVLGANCTLDSREMAELVKEIKDNASLPVMAQANAGQPKITTGGQLKYSQTADNYVKYVEKIIENGADIIGGCCGTNPSYIRKMAKLIRMRFL